MKQRGHSELVERWKAYGQAHLFAFWEDRSEAQRRALLGDLDSLNVETYELLQRKLEQKLEQPGRRRIEPAAYIAESEWRLDPEARAEGEDLLGAGKAAFLTVAGGQGSRLGFEGPKGCFPISPIRQAPLFQIFAEKIVAARRRYGRSFYWYIMTSPLNLEQTRRFFEDNEYFGLSAEEVLFFPQGLFPSLTGQGKLLLSENGGLFQNPNGHGGTIPDQGET